MFKVKTHCIRGHSLSGDNLKLDKFGHKHCKSCQKITGRIRVANNREYVNQYQKDYRYKNYNKTIETERKSDKKRYKAKTTYTKKWFPTYVKKLQIETLTHYGNGKLACVCCGVNSSFLFLTIDHIKGRSQDEKKNPRKRGWQLKQWLRQTYKLSGKWPEGYQTLCWNCNSARALNKGICPHKENTELEAKQDLV